MKRQLLRILNVHNVPSHYRRGIFAELGQRYEQEVVFFQGPKAWREQRNPLETHGFKAQVLQGPTPWRWLQLTKRLFFEPYDLIVLGLDGAMECALAYLASRLRGKPLVLWTGLWDPPRTLFHRLARPWVRGLERRADAVLAYGTHLRRTLIAKGVDPRKIFLAPQTVDNTLYATRIPAAVRAKQRRAWGLKRGQKAALFVGRLVPDKGLEYLQEALELPGTADWVLLLIGQGPLEAELQAQAAKTGRIRLLGYIPPAHLALAYASADCLVLPSITTATFREPWGLVVNEAFNQALPVLATDAVGAASGGLAEDGRSALVVPEQDSEALRHGLSRLSASPALAKRLGHEGKRRVAAWTYPAMARQFDAAIAHAQAPTLPRRPLARPLVTLSFDDGCAEDLRMARLLRKHRLKATFYIPLGNPERPVISSAKVRRLSDMGFEIGSHGITHRRLTGMPEMQVRREMFLSRQRLMRETGQAVRGFCFSGGLYRPDYVQWAMQEGYDYCRDTAMFRQFRPLDGSLLHTSIQLYPHHPWVYFKHLLKRRSARSLAWFAAALWRGGEELAPYHLAGSLFHWALTHNQAFHLWGHSYDLQSPADWAAMDAFCELISASPDARYCTNAEVFDALVSA